MQFCGTPNPSLIEALGIERWFSSKEMHFTAKTCSVLDGAGAVSRAINYRTKKSFCLPIKAPIKNEIIWMTRIVEMTTNNFLFDKFSKMVPAIEYPNLVMIYLLNCGK